MEYSFNNEKIRYTGRWFDVQTNILTTTTGAVIEFAFKGDMALMEFDVTWCRRPFPHLYISVDNGAMIESPVDAYTRIKTPEYGDHTVKIIVKSAVEGQHRWYAPLEAVVCFKGVTVDELTELEPDNRKVIEFVGDSITEGVLIDEDKRWFKEEVFNRVFQDDVTATYGYLTAEKLGLKPIIMGYGAVGVTKGGSGSVPKASECYPYCFHCAKISHKPADYVVMNYGANDVNSKETYKSEYKKVIDLVREYNPNAKIALLSPFCGIFVKELKELTEEYNKEYATDIKFIDGGHWVPKDPLHPLRDGHKKIADGLSQKLVEAFGL